METRRSFLKTTGTATTGIIAASQLANGQAANQLNQAQAAQAAPAGVVEHQLPPLPYAFNALEPYIDAETLEIHHDRHHAGYVKGLNNAEKALAAARAANDYALVQHWSRQYAFHGAGNALHTLYWTVMAAPGSGGGGQPEGALAEAINKSFGGFDQFKNQFSSAAGSVEASGWCALHYRPEHDRLLVLQIENHQKLTPWFVTPLMVIDVWEHAYYLKYRNKRDDYIAAWWNVVNWPQVAKNYAVAKGGTAA